MYSNKNDTDYACRGPSQGFKVLLHSPSEFPQVSNQYFRVPFGQEINVVVKPQMITTSDELKDYKPDQRQCYFNNERYLKFFNVYTQKNCELECLANYTLQQCSCVKFSMPRDENTPICGAGKIECYLDASIELSTKSAGEEEGQKDCKCLPACTSMQYDAELSQNSFEWENFIRATKLNVTVTEG